MDFYTRYSKIILSSLVHLRSTVLSLIENVLRGRNADLSQCCSLVQIIFTALYLRWGGARHTMYLSETQYINARRFSNLTMIPFILCTAITKISIALMVIRITTERWMKRSMYALVVSMALVYGVCVIILFTYCSPSHALWDSVPHAKCRPIEVLQVTSNIQGGKILYFPRLFMTTV